ncbi:unnamed protein product [Adineta steineri]|uniref:Uncharacterized protein n=1 Tax=Adineta steineri TaxID=433720 RepID=A0A815VMW5_9BILA|nr:unnamed protein product [Adineta steineri]
MCPKQRTVHYNMLKLVCIFLVLVVLVVNSHPHGGRKPGHGGQHATDHSEGDSKECGEHRKHPGHPGKPNGPCHHKPKPTRPTKPTLAATPVTPSPTDAPTPTTGAP